MIKSIFPQGCSGQQNETESLLQYQTALLLLLLHSYLLGVSSVDGSAAGFGRK